MSNLDKSKPKTVEDWKNEGNSYYLKKDYVGAVQSYTDGLLVYPKSMILLSNRSATYLNMKAFRSALKDANQLLEIEPSHVKASHRKVKALCGLEKYQEALEFIGTIKFGNLKVHDRKEFEKLKLKVESYLHQQQTGDYDFSYMLRDANNVGRTFDYADYIGPVEVRESPGKGRGLFVTKDVEAGQLLIGAKAFVIHVSEQVSGGKIDPRNLNSLANAVANILRMAPEKREEFFNVYPGPVMGLFKFEAGKNTHVMDMNIIESICACNMFRSPEISDDGKQSEGVWLLPSFINHMCYDYNCISLAFGNFTLIRALKHIAKDEEVFLSYFEPYTPFNERLDQCKQRRFLCDCRLCKFEHQEDMKIHKAREQLLPQVTKVYSEYRAKKFDFDNVSAAEFCVEMITALRPDNLKMNVYLVRPLIMLGDAYLATRQFGKALETLEKAYEIADFPIDNINIITSFVLCKLATKDNDEADEWIERLKTAMSLLYGTLEVDSYPLLKQFVSFQLRQKNMAELR